MKSFYYYLKTQRMKESTMQEHLKNMEHFSTWIKQTSRSGIEQISYPELVEYVQYLKEKKLEITTINIRLGSIRKYYDHLKEEGEVEKNPAKRLHIKGAVKKVVQDVLTYTELENLYQQYVQYSDQQTKWEKRKQRVRLRSKVIAGLMVWQAVHGGELERLETKDVKLSSGIIYIPAGTRSNSRELKLNTSQIIPLHDYLNSLPEEQTKLFDRGINNQLTRITNELQGINPVVRNAQHIRASVILHWLKMYDKRQVQHMIGHRHISSTENYQLQELDGLTDLLAKHHPFA